MGESKRQREKVSMHGLSNLGNRMAQRAESLPRGQAQAQGKVISVGNVYSLCECGCCDTAPTVV